MAAWRRALTKRRRRDEGSGTCDRPRGGARIRRNRCRDEDPDIKLVGGGWIEDPDILGDPTAKIHFGFEIPCSIDDPEIRPNLQVTWRRNRFHMSEASAVSCTSSGDQTATGEGVGVCNGSRATVRFRFTNDEEISAGVFADRAELEIFGAAAGCTLAVSNELGGGNIKFIEDPDI